MTKHAKRNRRVGEEAVATLEVDKTGATPEQVDIVTERIGRTIIGVRATMVMHGLSEGQYTAKGIADLIGFQPRVVADAARELVESGLAVERSPGIWRLTREGWNRIHDLDNGEE